MKEVDDRCFGECMGEIICCIYMIMRISTGQKYIGQTNDFYRRMSEHYSNGTTRIDKAITKYGKNDFYFQVLEILPDDIEVLNNREEFWIKYYNTYKNPFHYNEHKGGVYYRKSKSEVWNYANEICELYEDNDIYIEELARQFNCNGTTIARILKENNIKLRGGKSKVWDYADEICELYKNTDVSIYNLGERFGCSSVLISEILKDNNVKIKDYRSEGRKSANKVCELYQNTDMTMEDLGKQFNCSPCTIGNILRENNIEVRKTKEVWDYANEICKLYQNTDMTTEDLGRQFNCSHKTICKILKKNNINPKEYYKHKRVHKAWNHTDEICRLYKEEDITVSELARQFNCSNNTITKMLEENNIEIKYTPKKHKAWNYANNIKKLFFEDNMTANELSKQFNCTPKIIYDIVKK